MSPRSVGTLETTVPLEQRRFTIGVSRLNTPAAKLTEDLPPVADPLGGYQQGRYLRNVYRVDSRLVTSEAHAQALAHFLYRLLSYPTPDLEVTVGPAMSEAEELALLKLEVWDRVHLELPNLGIDVDYYIERLGLADDPEGGNQLTAHLFLVPAVAGTSKIGRSALGPFPGKVLTVFDGTDDYVDFGDVLDQAGALTAEAWIRLDAVPAPAGRVINKDDGAAGWALEVNTSRQVAFVTRGLSTVTLTGTTTLDVGRWYHVAAAWDPSTGRKTIFLNGAQEAQSAVLTGALAGNAAPLRIGRHSSGSSFLRGVAAELRLWNAARDLEDVNRDRAEVLEGDEDGLAGYWPLNEPDGVTALAWGGGLNNGAINGTPVRETPDWLQLSA